MSLKPIEPGCLAVIIGARVPENNGKVVRVIEYVGDYVQNHPLMYRWRIDTKLRAAVESGGELFYYCLIDHVAECQLLRIDGEDFQEDVEETCNELSNVWNAIQ